MKGGHARGTTLLIGNGFNRIGGGASWEDVIADFAKRSGVKTLGDLRVKPLPLVYEQIVARVGGPKDGWNTEFKLKGQLASGMKELSPNSHHTALMLLPVRHVLTTNYDYCLEQALASTTGKRANLKRETTYSAFRRRRVEGKYVWHVHGEIGSPYTLMLGLHQYAGYLQKVRAYLTPKDSDSPFKMGIPDFDDADGPFSWVDVFLRDDVHVIGLTLDYSEIVLWWLLAYKERLRRRAHKERLPERTYGCGRTFYYHAPMRPPGRHTRARLELMEGLGVKVVRIAHSGEWSHAYGRMIAHVRRSL